MIIKPFLEQQEAVAMVIQVHHGGHGHANPSSRKGECEDTPFFSQRRDHQCSGWMFLRQGALQLRFHVVPLARLTLLLKPLPFSNKVRRLIVMTTPCLSQLRKDRF